MYASNRPTLGRRMLMTDEREITKDNIISVVSKAFMEHQENVAQEVFLFEYEKGNQPILNREKKIRPDLNATVVENNASKIVDVHLGYCFSNPITFVQRAKIEPTKKQKKALFGFLRKKDEDDGENIDDLKIAMLNKMMQEQSKAAKDIALGRNLFICGVGYQMMLPNRNKSRYSPFELLVPSPLTTFVVYSNDAYREALFMKRITGLMKNICTMKNALNAYQKARRCKRYRPEVLEFEANREEYLGKAIRELESLTYTPGKYKVFKVWEPKERIIMALPFYDRVIQHMIVNYIEPIFEHQFIYHSYACRKGKGAHRASKQLTRWLYNLEVVQGKSVYVLKADIHHYFQSIDHKVLKREIRTYIKDKDLLVILDRIIDHNGIFPDGVGIPVGNLTSQLFANVYLHRLDMFVKHTLHAEHYMRYMDDFVIISEDLEQLKRWEKQIEIFLADVLKLQLNPKTTIVYAKNGVDFVGYRHWNSTKKIRKDAMRRLKRLMKNFKDGTITEEFFDKSFTSRIGSIKHADTYNLVQKITCEAKELKESHA